MGSWVGSLPWPLPRSSLQRRSKCRGKNSWTNCGIYLRRYFSQFPKWPRDISADLRPVSFSLKVPGVNLHGYVMWFPEQFISGCLPEYGRTIDKKILLALTANRQNYLQWKSHALGDEVKDYRSQVSFSWEWFSVLFLSQYIFSCNLFIPFISCRPGSDAWRPYWDGPVETKPWTTWTEKAIFWSRASSWDVKSRIQSWPWSTSTENSSALLQSKDSNRKNLGRLVSNDFFRACRTEVVHLCKLIELLKALQHTFDRQSLRILDVIGHVTQYIAYSMIKTMLKAGVREMNIYNSY